MNPGTFEFFPALTLFFLNFVLMFIFEKERERDRARVGEGQRERGRHNPEQASGSELSAQSPTWDSNP